jgi:hypothetical protein
MVDVVLVEVVDIDDVVAVIRLAAVRIIPGANIAWRARTGKVKIQKCAHEALSQARGVALN